MEVVKSKMPLRTSQRNLAKRKEPPEIVPQNPDDTDDSTTPKLKRKLSFRNLLKNGKDKAAKKDSIVRKSLPGKGKPKQVIDLEMMKEELKPFHDPPITPLEKQLSSARLEYQFFNTPCEELAQKLLGKILVRQLENGIILKGRIVETESYLGSIDKACQTYQNRVTPRNIPMYMPPGTIYIYLTYGMYHCFNISSQEHGSAVLLRAVEPLEGIEHMTELRNSKAKSKGSQKTLKDFKPHELCNGPSKLCMSYKLERVHNKYSMCTWKGMWIENDISEQEIKIVQCARIGIDSAGPEWAQKPLRYYIHGNKSVSKRDKKKEIELEYS